MSNLGKAIFMACFALMFVFAATTAIYLYGTLNTYLDSSTTLTTIGNRTESATENSKTEREITRSEIYITLYNMEAMYVDKLEVDGVTVTSQQVNDNAIPSVLLNNLRDAVGTKYGYTYKVENVGSNTIRTAIYESR